MWFLLSGLLVGTFMIRWLPKLLVPGAVGSDTYLHMYMARIIRENNHKIPDEVPRVTMCKNYTYPYFYHWILSFVPDQFLIFAEGISGAIIDTIFVAWAFLFSLFLFEYLGVEQSTLEYAMWVAALCSVSPALLSVASGPRAYNGSPRPLGQLLFSVFAGSIVLFNITGIFVWLGIAVLAVAFLSITSKFGNQVLIFMGLGLLAFGYYEPMLVIITGYLVAGLFSKGRAWKVLEGQVRHSVFYATTLQEKYIYPAHQGFLSYFLRTFGLLKSWIRNPILFLTWLFNEQYLFHRIFVVFPQFFILLFLCFDSSMQNSNLEFIWYIIVISFIIGLITNVKPFLFLGEALRYPEHTILLQYMLFVFYVIYTDAQILLLAIFTYSVIAIPFFVFQFTRVFVNSQAAFNHVPDIVKQLDQPDKRLYAMGPFFWTALFFSQNLKVAIHGANFDSRSLDYTQWYDLFGNFPYPTIPLHKLLDKQRINYVLADENSLANYERLIDDNPQKDNSVSLIQKVGKIHCFKINETTTDKELN